MEHQEIKTMNTRTLLTLILCSFLSFQSFSQREITREAYIRFFSSTSVEDIEAVSNQASSVIDKSNGSLAFQVLMRSFTFEKALMQEHFNENYIESDQFPMATFRGSFVSPEDIDFDTDGSYSAQVSGTFEVHGVSQQREIPVSVIVQNGVVRLESTFKVKPADHNIDIPSVVRDKIAREVEVTVKAQYQPL